MDHKLTNNQKHSSVVIETYIIKSIAPIVAI